MGRPTENLLACNFREALEGRFLSPHLVADDIVNRESSGSNVGGERVPSNWV